MQIKCLHIIQSNIEVYSQNWVIFSLRINKEDTHSDDFISCDDTGIILSNVLLDLADEFERTKSLLPKTSTIACNLQWEHKFRRLLEINPHQCSFWLTFIYNFIFKFDIYSDLHQNIRIEAGTCLMEDGESDASQFWMSWKQKISTFHCWYDCIHDIMLLSLKLKAVRRWQWQFHWIPTLFMTQFSHYIIKYIFYVVFFCGAHDFV